MAVGIIIAVGSYACTFELIPFFFLVGDMC